MLLTLFFIVTFIACGENNSSSNRHIKNRENINNFLSYNNKELLSLVNKIRSQARVCYKDEGLIGPSSPLKWNSFLTFSAYEHSRDMALSNIFTHDGSGTVYDITGALYGKKSRFSERIHRHLEIPSIPTGENIAVGMYDIEEVMNAWLASPKHCINIMSEEFTDIGMAIVTEEESFYGIYWTQDFAKID